MASPYSSSVERLGDVREKGGEGNVYLSLHKVSEPIKRCLSAIITSLKTNKLNQMF